MLEMRGHVKRKLVPVLLEAGATALVGAPVADGAGVEVGKLTSVAVHPAWNQAVGLAMVKLAQSQVDTALRVGEASAKVFAPA
jgi:glycine cleavage system aminomethyltransferase T